MSQIQYVVLMIIQLAIIGTGLFLKSYLTKKGENLATTEDLSKLTNTVEDVKLQYLKIAENNKSLNSIYVNRLIDFYAKKDEFLFELIEEIDLLSYMLFCAKPEFLGYEKENVEILKQHLMDIESKVNHINLISAKVVAFFKDEGDISDQIRLCLSPLLKLNLHLVAISTKVDSAIFELYQNDYLNDENGVIVVKNKEEIRKFVNEISDLFLEYIDRYSNERNTYQERKDLLFESVTTYYSSLKSQFNDL